jgi:hypothetical protein
VLFSWDRVPERISGDGIGDRALGQGQAMSQQFSQSYRGWRGGRSERLWLSTLIDTMEKASQPSRRAEPSDGQVLAALRAQLALPAASHFVRPFNLPN